jgi:hypothetical protein
MASLQRLVGDSIAGNILRLASGGRIDNLNLNAMSTFLDAVTDAPIASPISSKSQAVVQRKCLSSFGHH